MESRDNTPTLKVLKAKLKEEEARQNDRNAKANDGDKKSYALLAKGSTNRGKQRMNREGHTKSNTPKFDGKCFNCDKIRHRSRDCRAKQRQNKSGNTDNALTAVACNAELSMKSAAWCLDSGATRHMCNNKEKFEAINEDDQSKMYTAEEHFVESIRSGNVSLHVRANRREDNSIKIQNALYVPKLRNNLLSVPSITDKGHSVVFKRNRAFIKRKDGSTILTAMKRNQLYVVDEKMDRAMLAKNKHDGTLLK